MRGWVLLPAFVASFLLAGLFADDLTVRVLLSMPAALVLSSGLRSALRERKERSIRDQYQALLQNLCAFLSAGHTPESALQRCADPVAMAFGPRAALPAAIRKASRQMASGRSLPETLSVLVRILPCPEAAPLLEAIGGARLLGGHVLEVLRGAHRMMNELATTRAEAEAAASQRRTEALLLCAMPPAMALLLRLSSPDYMAPAFRNPSGSLLLGVAFLLFMGGMGLTLRLLAGIRKTRAAGEAPRDPPGAPTGGPTGGPTGRLSIRASGRWTDRLAATRPIRRLAAAYPRRLPPFLRERWFRTQPDEPSGSRMETERLCRHMARKAGLLGAALPMAAVLALLVPIPPLAALPAVPVFLLGLSCLQDEELRAFDQHRRHRLLLDLPLFLGMLCAMLQAGFSLRRSLEACRPLAGPPGGPLSESLENACSRVASGVSPSSALDAMAEACPIPEAASALSLAAQCERLGGPTPVELLRLQSGACWTLRRSAERASREKDGIRLLLPMVLNLLSVLSVAAAPALSVLRS